jgi:general stress protein 26
MFTYLRLYFLQEKIKELQTALFYNLSSSVFKIPTSVVNVMETDDCGQIWFCLPPHGSLVNELDKEFPSLLQFFRKGKNFHVRINGKAHIVNDPEEVNTISWANDEMKNQAITRKVILIKVKIEFADYFEQKQRAKQRQTKREWVGFLKDIFAFVFETEYSKFSLLRIHKSNTFPGSIRYQ